MVAPDLVNLSGLLDDAKCFAFVRHRRWPENVCCPGCGSSVVIRDGYDDTQPHRQRYRCRLLLGSVVLLCVIRFIVNAESVGS
jgi:Transposase zinc-ribbon domain